MERNEESGNITLKVLKRTAEMMDCELLYIIRPKKRMMFSEVIWNSVLNKALSHHWVKSRPKLLKYRALAAVIRWHIEDPQFRLNQKWCVRHVRK
ncbi:MAG: hypothetical protein SGI74_08200 [Oligoflexia bacterium]|nr:hypothetical protein [Oligoflexia bacterium]